MKIKLTLKFNEFFNFFKFERKAQKNVLSFSSGNVCKKRDQKFQAPILLMKKKQFVKRKEQNHSNSTRKISSKKKSE